MFRPHVLSWTVEGKAVKDANGHYVPGASASTNSVPCRFISVGGRSMAKEFKNIDNTVVKQVGQIRIDAGPVYPLEGQQVTVMEGDKVHFTGVIRESYLGGQLGKWRFEV